jgi:hypothetical protein
MAPRNAAENMPSCSETPVASKHQFGFHPLAARRAILDPSVVARYRSRAVVRHR